MEGATIEEVLSRISEDVVRRELIPEVGKVTEGFEYKWVQDGKKYLDSNSLEFQPPGITNIASPYYSEELANSTHIPIKSPK